MKVASWSNRIQELNTKSTLIEDIYWFVAFGIEILIKSSMVVSLMSISLLISLAHLPASSNLLKTQRGSIIWIPALRRQGTSHLLSFRGKVYLKKETDVFLKRLSKKLADKWHRLYAQTSSFVKTCFTISLASAKNRRLRGSRIMTRKISHRVDWGNGAGF